VAWHIYEGRHTGFGSSAAVQALDLTIVMTSDQQADGVLAIINAMPLQVGPSATADCQRLL
jgi:hypothetical protein